MPPLNGDFKEISSTAIVTLSDSVNHIETHHYDEWVASGVHPDIIKLNVRSISGETVLSHLDPNRELKNHQLWIYKSAQKGGWCCDTTFKADEPRQTNQKPIKYENPRGVAPNPIELELPEWLQLQIAIKWGVEPKTPKQPFWEWVRSNPQIPVAVVEGVKKAGAVITTLLIPTIALQGHTTACIKNNDIQFAKYLHPSRNLYICFDNDEKTTTRLAVSKTIQKIVQKVTRNKDGELLEQARTKLKVCQWEQHKGIDDVLVNAGAKAVETIFKNAIDYANWIDTSWQTLGFKPVITFNSNKFQFTELHPETVLIGVKGAKGSGKTWYMEQLVKQARKQNRPIISIVHRIQLAISIANRLDLTYIEDVDGKISESTTLSLVIDSLHKINVNLFSGALVLIDEVVQVIEHALLSETCKYKRDKILKTLTLLGKQIIETGGQFVLADADLNERTLRFFIGLLGDGIEPYIIHNQYKEPSYKCFVTKGFQPITKSGKPGRRNASDIVAIAVDKALKGERVLLCLTGQDEESGYGTINIEKLFLSYGISSVLRIDSETTKNPEHPAYKATSKINQLCDDYQVVIGSPSMGTGVSIENKIPFNLVCGVFTGVGSTDSVRQFLMRVRNIHTPRLIYVADKGLSTGYEHLGSTNQQVDNKQAELFYKTQDTLDKTDADWLLDNPEIKEIDTARYFFNSFIADRNKETKQYSKYVIHGLKNEGVKIEELDNSKNASYVFSCDLSIAEVFERLKEVKENSIEFYRNELAKQELVSDDEYDKLKNGTDLTDKQRIALEAKILSKKYAGVLPITPDLIAKDADGWRNQIMLHYASTVGYDVITQLQLLSANSQVKRGEGTVIQHDFNERQKLITQVDFIRESGILNLLNKTELSANDIECIKVFEFLRSKKDLFEVIFSKKLECNHTDAKFDFKPIKCVLERLGITTGKAIKKGGKGNQVNTYPLNEINDNRDKVFTAFLERDTEKAKQWQESKKDWEINKLVKVCTDDIDLKYFKELETLEIFNDIWERVYTDTRINIINRKDGFKLPKPQFEEINPDSDRYTEILADIKTWSEVSLDIETFGTDAKNKEGLHPRKGLIRLLQISNGTQIYYVDLGGRADNREEIHSKLAEFFETLNEIIHDSKILKIGQNIHFDLRFLRFQYGFKRAKNIADTMLGAKIFFGDYGTLKVLPGGYGLGNLATKFLGLEVDKTEQKSDWGAELTTSQIEYAVKDPFITYHLYKRLLEVYENPNKFGFGKLAQDGLLEAWQLENDITPCAIELEVTGLPFDEVLAKENVERCKILQEQLLKEWAELVPSVNYTQNQKLKEHLNKKYDLNIKKLNKTALADLAEYPEIKLLGKLRAIKIPIQQFESLIRSAEQTGRVQTVFNTLTGTGRFSSGNSKMFKDLPNLQSISAKSNPALKEYNLPAVRTCVSVTDTIGLGIIDLAASHGRIAADVADDETAIAGCNDETIDNHSKVAVYIAKALGHEVTWEDIAKNKKIMPYKLYRDAAKNTYYGWLNGAGAKRIQEQIKANSGEVVSIEACKAAIQGCEALYPNVVNFRKEMISTLGYKANLLYVDGKYYAVNKVQSVCNRITHLVKVDEQSVDLPYTQCLAAIWSRTEATALKRALIQIIELADNKPEWELKAINYVHDEINVEFKIEYAETVLTTVNNIIGDSFALTLSKVNDGREMNWKKLLVKNWSEK